MKTTRREFGKVALGTAIGAMSGTTLLNSKAQAQTRKAHAAGVYHDGVMQLNQNESARGPGPKTLEAIRNHTTKRIGMGYSPDHVNELREGIANYYRVGTENVLLSTGSTPLLEAITRAYCDENKALVIPMPTYSTSLQAANRIKAKTIELPLGKDLGIDLDAVARNAEGSGLLYVCNPNNPTGTIHGPDAIEKFVRTVMRENPDVHVQIDEAYINYTRPGAMETALPLALEYENVSVTRSFSKAHGLAGMRIGYALAQEKTLEKIDAAWGLGDVNSLAAVAALTALEDEEHIAWEAQENAEIRDEVIGFFRSQGHEVPDSNTNHIFVNLGMPAAKFRAACLEDGILVGRDFPPLEQTHCRISLGSREQMKQALEVFKKALA